MEWRGRRQSSNIEDRRGEGDGFDPGGLGGGGFRLPTGGGLRRVSGGGISGIIVLIVLFFILRAFGIDMFQVLDEGGGAGYEQSQNIGRSGGANDEMK
ncbi:MAG: neutral zinc metallopeptidase, partial [Pararhizobium sp.]